MSGAVKQIKRGIESAFGSGDAQALPRTVEGTQARTQQAAAEAPQPAGRVASEGEKAMALRRRRGTRALLSQERLDAEAALGGEKTTLGSM